MGKKAPCDCNVELMRMTGRIVEAHLGNNTLSLDEVPVLIETVYEKLAELNGIPVERHNGLEPATPIDQSVTDDYLVCLEDGRKLKMLKRHLGTVFNLTPEAYREKWGLPADYPMVAPNYARKRQELAKKIGLGHR